MRFCPAYWLGSNSIFISSVCWEYSVHYGQTLWKTLLVLRNHDFWEVMSWGHLLKHTIKVEYFKEAEGKENLNDIPRHEKMHVLVVSMGNICKVNKVAKGCAHWNSKLSQQWVMQWKFETIQEIVTVRI